MKKTTVNIGEKSITTGHDWTRKDRTALANKEPGKRYRHVWQANVELKKMMGWVVDETQTSNLPGHVVMYMPEEMAISRNEFFLEKDRINRESSIVDGHPHIKNHSKR